MKTHKDDESIADDGRSRNKVVQQTKTPLQAHGNGNPNQEMNDGFSRENGGHIWLPLQEKHQD